MFKVYVDGQLGLPFDSLDEAEAAALSFQEEGFDVMIILETSQPEDPDQ